MAPLYRDLDWAATKLGPVEKWSDTLRTMLRLCLESAFPMAIYWGEESVLLYNDDWVPIAGAKHPWALGRPGAEVWPEIWDQVGPQFLEVLATGKAIRAPRELLIMHRNGYAEECYFDYSLNPIRGANGRVNGILNAVTEITPRIVGERRLRILRALLLSWAGTESPAQVAEAAAGVFNDADAEVPFSLIYLLGETGQHAYLAGMSGLPPNSDATPPEISLTPNSLSGNSHKPDAVPPFWPLYEVAISGTSQVVDGLDEKLANVGIERCGPWPEMPRTGLILPLSYDGSDCALGTPFDPRICGFLVVGVNARRELDSSTRTFFEQASEHIAGGVHKANADKRLQRARIDAEEARARAEAAQIRLRFALNAASLGDWELDLSTGKMISSDQCRANFGLPPMDAPDAPSFDYDDLLRAIHPDDLPGMRSAVHAAITTHALYRAEYRAVWPDGTTHWIEAHARVEYDSEDNAVRMTGVTQDVTERTQASDERARMVELLQAQSRASENDRANAERVSALLLAVFDSMPSAVYVGTMDGITAANRIALSQLGFESIDALNQDIRELSSIIVTRDPQTGSRLSPEEEPFLIALKEGRSTARDVQIRHLANGEDRIIYCCASPVFNAAGEVVAAVAVNTDVTDERRMEREREQLLASTEAARIEADAANRSKGDFLAVMSHELRTPLNAIGGYAELIEIGVRGPVNEQQRSDLTRIRQSQKHLLGLINQVLNYTRIESGSIRYDSREIVVAEILAEAESLVIPQILARGLTHNFSACPPSLSVIGDWEKLQQVLLNLLTNSIKFTLEGGEISVECSTHDEMVEIAVSDTGVGIAPAKLESIFEPFVQIDQRLTRSHEGVGLGLAISRDLARGMGGDLIASSDLGKGSRFAIRLPHAK